MEQQADDTRLVASCVEELSRSVAENAEHASRFNDSAQGIAEHATSAAREVGDTRAVLDSVQESSRRIESIVDLIDDIAFQTNVLALNAAVSAVDQALARMDQAVQQLHDATRENSLTADALKSQAGQLSLMAGRFHVDEDAADQRRFERAA